MQSVMVADDSGIDYVKYSQRNLLSNYRASTDIVKGSLLVGPMLSDKSQALPSGKVLVGLSLKAGQYPQDLAVGDYVAAYQVGSTDGSSSNSSGTSGSGGGNALLVQQAKVEAVDAPGGDSNGADDLPVSVLVDQSDAAALTAAAAASEVAVVKVSKSG
jgi:hypothetical protein